MSRIQLSGNIRARSDGGYSRCAGNMSKNSGKVRRKAKKHESVESLLTQVLRRFAVEWRGKKPIGHLLLVAGFSGAGKSTFMNQHAAGELPRDILWLIPED